MKSVLLQYYQAFNSGNYEGMLALLSDDVLHEPSQGEPRKGKQLFREFLQHMERCYKEQVIDPVSLMRTFAARNRGRIFTSDHEVEAGQVILAAGEGNAELRKNFGLAENVMQRRPLHMVMARGNLPELFGHCIGGAKPRITVTTARDSAGRTVWQVGGQIAEEGVKMSMEELVKHAARELLECVPGLKLDGVEVST